MTNNEKYFNAPIFESSKSTYALRYHNESELKLMRLFDTEPKIKNYHQPLMLTLVKDYDREQLINVDFWVEYITGKTDLIYLERDFAFSEKAVFCVLTNDSVLTKAGSFGIVIASQIGSRFRRVADENIRLIQTDAVNDVYSANFQWVN